MTGGTRIQVLGPFRLMVDGRTAEVPGDRQRALLAVLAMAAGELVSVESIGEQVWDDERPVHMRRSVHTLVARLRQALGPQTIVTRPGGYRLTLDPHQVDAVRFMQLLREAAHASDEGGERAKLAEALGLWRGEPFEGIQSTRFTDSTSSRLTQRYLAAVERRVDLDVADGDPNGLADELRRLTERYPMRESLWARLITVLARSGRQAEALESYEVVRARIADELGADPGTELRRIHLGLLSGKGTQSGAGERTDPTTSVPRQLPSDVQGFAGRVGALESLDRLLDEEAAGSGPVVITAVHGTGGVGKTTLAVHWAHRIKGWFPDGQLYLNLRGYGSGGPMDSATALDIMLRSLGVPGDQIPTTVEGRSALLRTMLADRRMLVVLDNARDPEQVRPLLPGEGRSLVIVTSRSQLRGLAARDGASRVWLDALSPEESAQLLAVHLRQQAVSHDDDAIAELTELCGHLPLALVMAAERAGRHPAVGLADLLHGLRNEQERLDALETADDPPSSLRAVFTWSYQALSPATARMFRLLALHPASEIGVAAAAALAGTSTAEAARLLDRLLEAHLLEERRPGRYDMHDLLRVYATERGKATDSAAECAAATRRMGGWYVHAAARARAVVDGFPLAVDVGELEAGLDVPTFDAARQARTWLDAEWETLVAATKDAYARGQHTTVCRLVLAMFTTVMTRCSYVEGFELLELGLESARTARDKRAEGYIADRLGSLCAALGRPDDELAWCSRSRDLFEEIGDVAGETTALGNLGATLAERGRLAESEECLDRALVLARQLGRVHEEGKALNHLALTYLAMGRNTEAVEAAEEAVRIRHAVGDRFEAFALDTLGSAFIVVGKHQEAVDCLRRAIAIQREYGTHRSVVIALRNLGRAQHALGEIDAARASWREALRIYDDLRGVHSPGMSRAALVEQIEGLPAS